MYVPFYLLQRKPENVPIKIVEIKICEVSVLTQAENGVLSFENVLHTKFVMSIS
jgi:hypothetical protein